MPISMGVVCEECGILYLITAKGNKHIDCLPSSAGPDMFVLRCTACGIRRSFHKNDLRPYAVSIDSYTRGYAKPDEYKAQQGPARRIA